MFSWYVWQAKKTENPQYYFPIMKFWKSFTASNCFRWIVIGALNQFVSTIAMPSHVRHAMSNTHRYLRVREWLVINHNFIGVLEIFTNNKQNTLSAHMHQFCIISFRPFLPIFFSKCQCLRVWLIFNYVWSWH